MCIFIASITLICYHQLFTHVHTDSYRKTRIGPGTGLDGLYTAARPGTPFLDISPQPFNFFSSYFTASCTHKVLLVVDGKVVEPVVIQALVGSPAVSMGCCNWEYVLLD